MKRHLSYMAVGFCQTKKNNLWTTELLNKLKKNKCQKGYGRNNISVHKSSAGYRSCFPPLTSNSCHLFASADWSFFLSLRSPPIHGVYAEADREKTEMPVIHILKHRLGIKTSSKEVCVFGVCVLFSQEECCVKGNLSMHLWCMGTWINYTGLWSQWNTGCRNGSFIKLRDPIDWCSDK